VISVLVVAMPAWAQDKPSVLEAANDFGELHEQPVTRADAGGKRDPLGQAPGNLHAGIHRFVPIRIGETEGEGGG
jgi:hypothetical protein